MHGETVKKVVCMFIHISGSNSIFDTVMSAMIKLNKSHSWETAAEVKRGKSFDNLVTREIFWSPYMYFLLPCHVMAPMY
jgi:hypothetical protein